MGLGDRLELNNKAFRVRINIACFKDKVDLERANIKEC